MAIGFKVRINGGSFVNVVTDVGNVNSHTFTGLDYETEYDIEVEKYNDGGESAYAGPLSATMRTPPNNVALASNGATVAVSSEYDAVATPKAALINGDRTGGSGILTGGGNWVSSADPTVTPQWAEITFASSKSISEVDVIGTPTSLGYEPLCAGPTLAYDDPTYAITDFKVQYWDGAAWVDIVSYTSNVNGWRKAIFAPITTTKIRLYITNTTTGLGKAYVTEVEAWETDKNPIVVVNEGDSRIQSSSVSAELQRLLNHNYAVQTIATSGEKINDMVTGGQIASQAVPLYNAHAVENIIIQSGGVNDIGAGRSVAQIQTDLTTWCGQARAAGFKIILCTVCQFGPNANIDTLNAWILTNPGGMADIICDLAGDPSLIDPNDTTFYSDGLHWTSLGATVATGLMHAAVLLLADY